MPLPTAHLVVSPNTLFLLFLLSSLIPPSYSSVTHCSKMSNILWKNFYLCFTKFKCLPTNLSPPQTTDFEEDGNLLQSNSTNEACLVKNFNSIYNITSGSTSKCITCSTEDFFSTSSNDSEDGDSNVPDFSSVLASQRFFFSDPGESNSIVEEPGRQKRLERPPMAVGGGCGIVSGGVAVNTLSPDPYADFRRSMQEMVEAHELRDVRGNWDFLHELLLCYLSLNPKHTHKLIIGAFTDLVVSLMAKSTADHSRRTTLSRHCSIARLLM